MALAGSDSARLQRATQGSGESTGSGRHDVVEGRGVRLEGSGPGTIVLRHLVMDAEHDGRGFRRQIGLPQGALDSFDPHLRYVSDASHLDQTIAQTKALFALDLAIGRRHA